MSKIISISGRLGSGKTELANMCIKHGYERMYFAYPLKDMLRRYFRLDSIEELNMLKSVAMDVSEIDEDTIEFFSINTGIDTGICAETLMGIKPEFTMRDWLQFIGTDLIRANDPEWHVRRTLTSMDPNKNYVFDDARFPNEIEALINKGAEAWYIIRNKTDNVSNHESETRLSLESPYFKGHIIPNDGPLELFKSVWEEYITTGQIRASWQEIIDKYDRFGSDLIREVEAKASLCNVKASDNGRYIILEDKDNGNTEFVFDLLRVELYKKYINHDTERFCPCDGQNGTL